MDSNAGGTYVDLPGRGPTEVVEVNGLHVPRSHVDRLGPLLAPAVTSHLCRAGVTPALGGRWRDEERLSRILRWRSPSCRTSWRKPDTYHPAGIERGTATSKSTRPGTTSLDLIWPGARDAVRRQGRHRYPRRGGHNEKVGELVEERVVRRSQLDGNPAGLITAPVVQLIVMCDVRCVAGMRIRRLDGLSDAPASAHPSQTASPTGPS